MKIREIILLQDDSNIESSNAIQRSSSVNIPIVQKREVQVNFMCHSYSRFTKKPSDICGICLDWFVNWNVAFYHVCRWGICCSIDSPLFRHSFIQVFFFPKKKQISHIHESSMAFKSLQNMTISANSNF